MTVEPTCCECGKPTGFYKGKPRRYCAPEPGKRQSKCHKRADHKRTYARRSPEWKKAKAEKEMARRNASPEARAAWQEWRRTYQAEHAERLAAEKKAWREANPEKVREYRQRRRAKIREQARQWSAANRDRLAGYQRTYYARHREKVRAAKRRWQLRQPGAPQVQGAFAGSVLAAASPRTDGHDMLTILYDLAPRGMLEDDRAEAICEAAMLMLEGYEPKAAMQEGIRRIRKAASFLRHSTRPIEECFHL